MDTLINMLQVIPYLPHKDKIISNLKTLRQYLPDPKQPLNMNDLINLGNISNVQNSIVNIFNAIFPGTDFTIEFLNDRSKVNLPGLLTYFGCGIVSYLITFVEKTTSFWPFRGGEAITIAVVIIVLAFLTILAYLATLLVSAFAIMAPTVGLTIVAITGLMMLPEIIFSLKVGLVDDENMRMAAKKMYGPKSTYFKDRNESITKIATTGLTIIGDGFNATANGLTYMASAATTVVTSVLSGGSIQDDFSKLAKQIQNGQVTVSELLNIPLKITEQSSILEKILTKVLTLTSALTIYLEQISKGQVMIPRLESIVKNI